MRAEAISESARAGERAGARARVRARVRAGIEDVYGREQKVCVEPKSGPMDGADGVKEIVKIKNKKIKIKIEKKI